LVARETPEGRPPVSVKLIGASPFAVTAKVPVAPSANEIDAAEVNTGAEAPTVKVKDWAEVFELASVAVMVIGKLPALPKAGVPARVPLAPRDTPEGRAPTSLKLIGVSPVAVTENVPAVFSANVVEDAEVNEAAVAVTVRVNDCVVVLVLASVAVMVIG
jgi:hypothetical protein